MSDLREMSKEEEKKMKAKWAVDTIIAAEQHKKDKELKSYIKAEMKERAKVLDSAMGKSNNGSAKLEAKKSVSKKKK